MRWQMEGRGGAGPAQREEMSFQAVTGASTNAPSVGGEAWLRLSVRG